MLPKLSDNRLRYMDGCRAICVILVVLFHYTYVFVEKYAPDGITTWKTGSGGVGVSLFFVISGFVILMTLGKKNFKGFVVSRISRLYPAYILSVVITSIAIIFIGDWYKEVELDNFLKNLTMFQYYLGGSDIDGVYWSLRVEVAFYAGIAILFYYLPLRYFWSIVAFLTLISCLINYFAQVNTLPVILDYARKLLIFEFIPYFALGLLLYTKSGNDNIVYCQSNNNLLQFVIAVAAVTDLLINKDLNKSIFVISMVGVLHAFSHGKLDVLKSIIESKFLVYIGRLSYSIYLLHQVIGYLLLKLLLNNGIHFYGALAITMLLVLILSHAVFVFAENKASYIVRKKLTSYIR